MNSPVSGANYSVITELPGDQITREGLRMLHTRYAFARELCEGKDVLELACGPAVGLKYLSRHARSVVGGDYNRALLQRVQGGVPLVCLDAHYLPFADASFDVILLCEAIYYLNQPEHFLGECTRVLRRDGALLISLPNREWQGFNPSPFSTRYFSVSELFELLPRQDFELQVYGGFPSAPSTAAQLLRDRVRRFAVKNHLIPTTFKAKARLKRMFYGSLETVGTDFANNAVSKEPLVALRPTENSSTYRVLYAVARPSAKRSQEIDAPLHSAARQA